MDDVVTIADLNDYDQIISVLPLIDSDHVLTYQDVDHVVSVLNFYLGINTYDQIIDEDERVKLHAKLSDAISRFERTFVSHVDVNPFDLIRELEYKYDLVKLMETGFPLSYMIKLKESPTAVSLLERKFKLEITGLYNRMLDNYRSTYYSPSCLAYANSLSCLELAARRGDVELVTRILAQPLETEFLPKDVASSLTRILIFVAASDYGIRENTDLYERIVVDGRIDSTIQSAIAKREKTWVSVRLITMVFGRLASLETLGKLRLNWNAIVGGIMEQAIYGGGPIFNLVALEDMSFTVAPHTPFNPLGYKRYIDAPRLCRAVVHTRRLDSYQIFARYFNLKEVYFDRYVITNADDLAHEVVRYDYISALPDVLGRSNLDYTQLALEAAQYGSYNVFNFLYPRLPAELQNDVALNSRFLELGVMGGSRGIVYMLIRRCPPATLQQGAILAIQADKVDMVDLLVTHLEIVTDQYLEIAIQSNAPRSAQYLLKHYPVAEPIRILNLAARHSQKDVFVHIIKTVNEHHLANASRDILTAAMEGHNRDLLDDGYARYLIQLLNSGEAEQILKRSLVNHISIKFIKTIFHYYYTHPVIDQDTKDKLTIWLLQQPRIRRMVILLLIPYYDSDTMVKLIIEAGVQKSVQTMNFKNGAGNQIVTKLIKRRFNRTL